MSMPLATAAFFSAFLLLLLLPLMPAFLELILKTDDAPLNVIPQNAGDVRSFAEGFRNYLSSVQPQIDHCALTGSDAAIETPDGDFCLVLAQTNAPHDLGIDEKNICSMVIAAVDDLALPPETIFKKDIYAKQRLRGGAQDQYRAILCESEVSLAESSVVMRWVHAVGPIHCEANCRLYGRISSEQSIQLSAGCLFTRLNADRIAIGASWIEQIPPAWSAAVRKANAEVTERMLCDGDLYILPGDIVDKHLVVRGELRIGAGARVLGNIKAEKAILLEPGVTVCGSLISSAVLTIGRGCRVRGPVIAERAVQIDFGTRAGTPDAPTTVSAPIIEVSEGVVIFGSLWARDHGSVVAPA